MPALTAADVTVLRFAAAVIEAHVDGRHRSQAAADLRALAARPDPAERRAGLSCGELAAAVRDEVWAE